MLLVFSFGFRDDLTIRSHLFHQNTLHSILWIISDRYMNFAITRYTKEQEHCDGNIDAFSACRSNKNICISYEKIEQYSSFLIVYWWLTADLLYPYFIWSNVHKIKQISINGPLQLSRCIEISVVSLYNWNYWCTDTKLTSKNWLLFTNWTLSSPVWIENQKYCIITTMIIIQVPPTIS